MSIDNSDLHSILLVVVNFDGSVFFIEDNFFTLLNNEKQQQIIFFQ